MRLVILLLTLAAFANCTRFQTPDLRHTSDVDDDVGTMVKGMSLVDKIGQMTQLDCVMFTNGRIDDPNIDMTALNNLLDKARPGSLFNNQMSPEQWLKFITTIQKAALAKNLTPILYGLDSVHGANYVYGAALFPQHITSACSFNPAVLKTEGLITAKDTKAVGIPWLFSPVLDLAIQPAWSRTYETFGEDSYLAATLGAAYVQGVQGADGNDLSCPTCMGTCLKHYMGYSAPISGHDRTSAWVPKRYMLDYFAKTFRAAITEGRAPSVMINSGDIDGVPVHSSYEYLTEVLEGSLGFKNSGVRCSDYTDIEKLVTWHHVARDHAEAIIMALDAGIDMSMVPIDFTFGETLLELVKSGRVSEARIDVSTSRILQLKKDVGLLSSPLPDPNNPFIKTIGQASDRAAALQAVRESVVVVQNNGILPLKAKRVLLTGPGANSLRMQNGGWSVHWQGGKESEFWVGTTLYQGIQKFANVTLVQGIDVDSVRADRASAIKAASSADVVVVAIGEEPYAEVPGDITSLEISQVQQDFIHDLYETHTPLVVVLLEGRPRVLKEIPAQASAVVAAFLPGSEGGQGIAEILFGLINPSGRLALTYPRATNDLCVYYHTHSESCNPQWQFGHGLTYTKFEYSPISLASRTWHNQDNFLSLTVTVTNKGPRAGNETVMLFLSDTIASITPPVKLLKRYIKVELAVGASKAVTFVLDKKDLEFHGRDNKPVIESGEFVISIQGSNGAAPTPVSFVYV